MHVSTIIVFCLLGVLNGENINVTTTETVNVTTPAITCKTAREVSGKCVERATCNYGPGVIDFTVYAPRGYKRPCDTSEVCCPLQHIVMGDPIPQTNKNENFEFDDDD